MSRKHIGKTRRNASGNFWTQCLDYVLRIEKNVKQALSSVDGLCPFPLRLAHPSSLPPFFFHIGIGLQLVALLYIILANMQMYIGVIVLLL